MKFRYLMMLVPVCLSVLNSYAQPSLLSQSLAGGGLRDSLTATCFTADGGSMACGTSISNISGDKTTNSKGGRDYWVVKYNSIGIIEWDKTIGGDSDDIFASVQQTMDGGYILGGYSASGISGDKTEENELRNDYWVVKLDNAGNIQWDRTIGGYGDDALTVVIQTSDGGYLLGGNSNSPKSAQKTDSSRNNSYDYWIVKLNNNGHIVWDKTIGGFYFEKLTCARQTKDKGYILGGYSESGISGEKTENTRGTLDYWLVKVNDTGAVLWDKTMGGDKRDQMTALQVTNDGGYIVAGFSQSRIFGEKTGGNRGPSSTSDYWVLKLDSLHNILWDKTIGGNMNDTCIAIIKTKDGGYMVGGYSTSGISAEKTESSRGTYDYWVIKLNGAGAIQWDKTLGGTGTDNLMGLYEIKKNFYGLAGLSGSDISGDKTIASKGDFDYWVVKLKYTKPAAQLVTKPENSIGENIVKGSAAKGFSAYPNPVKNTLFVQTEGNGTFSVTSQSGKILLVKTINGSGILNMSAIPPGLYYLKNNDSGKAQKIIVRK